MIDGFCNNLTEKLKISSEQLNFMYTNYDIYCLIPQLNLITNLNEDAQKVYISKQKKSYLFYNQKLMFQWPKPNKFNFIKSQKII